MLEREIETPSKRLARKQGWYVRKYATPANRSAPDDIFAKRGRVFWVEFKATGKTPTPLQLEEHRIMNEHGLTVYVCDSREKFRDILCCEEGGLASPV